MIDYKEILSLNADSFMRLFPGLPLYAGVLITAADVLIILVFFRSNSGRRGMMLFEFVIVSLVRRVFVFSTGGHVPYY